MFRVVNNKGFQIEFPNGWTASVMFGSTNYCDNRWKSEHIVFPAGQLESTTAEIRAWNNDTGAEFFNDEDNCAGWCTPEEVTKFLSDVAAQI